PRSPTRRLPPPTPLSPYTTLFRSHAYPVPQPGTPRGPARRERAGLSAVAGPDPRALRPGWHAHSLGGDITGLVVLAAADRARAEPAALRHGGACHARRAVREPAGQGAPARAAHRAPTRGASQGARGDGRAHGADDARLLPDPARDLPLRHRDGRPGRDHRRPAPRAARLDHRHHQLAGADPGRAGPPGPAGARSGDVLSRGLTTVPSPRPLPGPLLGSTRGPARARGSTRSGPCSPVPRRADEAW